MSFSSVNTQYEDSLESDPALLKKKIGTRRDSIWLLSQMTSSP